MRLFVALDIPNAVRDSLDELCKPLRELPSHACWVRIEGAHITLKFIGETLPEQGELIRSTLKRVRCPGPVELRFAGLGFFPNARRPSVLWAGVNAGEPLRKLVAAIETALEPLGIAREARDFSPHITLARFDSQKGLAALSAAIETLSASQFGTSTAREFHLYQSVLKQGGAEYTRLASYQISEEPAS